MTGIEILKKIPLFKFCSNQDLIKLFNLMQKVSFNEGDLVFRRGDVGDALYLIREGEVEVLAVAPDKDADDEDVVSVLGVGELFGEMALVEGEPRSATIRCKSPSKLLRLPKSYFEELVHKDHELAYKIYRPLTAILSRRLRETTERLAVANRVIRLMSRDRERN